MFKYTRSQDYTCPFCKKFIPDSILLHLENEECKKNTVSAKSMLILKQENILLKEKIKLLQDNLNKKRLNYEV